MALGGLMSLVMLAGLAGFVFWIVALVDALRRPADQWERAGQNQLIWVGVIVFANFVGALIYWLVARDQLESVPA